MVALVEVCVCALAFCSLRSGKQGSTPALRYGSLGIRMESGEVLCAYKKTSLLTFQFAEHGL
jgi:hypothetical protein